MHFAQVFDPSTVVSVNLTRRTMTELPHLYAMARHVVVDCPLLKIPRHVLEQVRVIVRGCSKACTGC